MSFGAAIKYCFKHPFTFTGRARRSEFWWFFLLLQIISLVLGVIFVILMFVALEPVISGTDPVTGQANDDDVIRWLTSMAILTGFATLVGTVIQVFMLAPNARRLHDIDQSAHWLWFYLVGLSIVPILMAIADGTRGPNKYGPDPKAAERAPLQPTAPGGYAAAGFAVTAPGLTLNPPPYAQPAAAPVANSAPASGLPEVPPAP